MKYSKYWKKIMSAGFLAAVSLSLVLPVYAEAAVSTGPGSERSEEEWAKLRDNTLEYGEIRGLVEEYNADVMEAKKTYQNDASRVKTAEQTARNLANDADLYDSMADEALSEIGGEMTAASYRLQADELRKQAAESTSDGSVVYQKYRASVTKKVKEVKDLFVSYYRALDAISSNQQDTAWKERELYYTKLKYGRGIIALSEVKNAEESLRKSKESAAGLQTEAENIRRSLITACGWTYDAQPVIGPMPSEQELVLTSEQDAQGLSLSIKNSPMLEEDRTRLENAKRMYGENDIYYKAQKQLEKDTETITDSYRSAREDLLLVQQKLSNEDAALQTARKQLALTEKQVQTGSASKMNLEKAQYEAQCAARTRAAVIYDLMQARHAYDAVCEGIQ